MKRFWFIMPPPLPSLIVPPCLWHLGAAIGLCCSEIPSLPWNQGADLRRCHSGIQVRAASEVCQGTGALLTMAVLDALEGWHPLSPLGEHWRGVNRCVCCVWQIYSNVPISITLWSLSSMFCQKSSRILNTMCISYCWVQGSATQPSRLWERFPSCSSWHINSASQIFHPYQYRWPSPKLCSIPLV